MENGLDETSNAVESFEEVNQDVDSSNSAFTPVTPSKLNKPEHVVSIPVTDFETASVEFSAIDVVRRCWELCSSSNSTDEDFGKAKELSSLLEKYPSLPINTLRDANQHSLLIHSCTKQGNAAAAQVFLCHTGSPDGEPLDLYASDVHGNTALHHAIMNQNTYAVKLLLDFVAANSAGSAKVVQYVEKTNFSGCNALHFAAEHGDFDILTQLLTVGVRENFTTGERTQTIDINCQDVDGFTPLHYSCMYAHPQLTYHLVSAEKAHPLIFNLAGELPSDLTKNALTKKFLMAATQQQLTMKADGITVEKKIRVERAYEEATKALLESIPGNKVAVPPPKPLTKSHFFQDSSWDLRSRSTVPVSPTRRSPAKAAATPRSPAHKPSSLNVCQEVLLVSPQVLKSVSTIDPKDTPALYDAMFKAMTEEAKQHIQQVASLTEPSTVLNDSPFKSPPKAVKVSPHKSVLNMSMATVEAGLDSSRFLSSSEKFAQSIAKFERHGTENVSIISSKTAPLDTGVWKPKPKLVVEINSDDEIVFKTIDGKDATDSVRRLRSSSVPLNPAAARQQNIINNLSQPKRKVEKFNSKEVSRSTTPAKGSLNRSTLSRQGSALSQVPSEALQKIKETVRLRRATISGTGSNAVDKGFVRPIVQPQESFIRQYSRADSTFELLHNPLQPSGRAVSAPRPTLQRTKSRINYFSNPLQRSGEKPRSKSASKSTSKSTNKSSMNLQAPLSPTRAYLSSLTPSKPYMVPTTSNAVSGGLVLEKRSIMLSGTIPRSLTNRYHLLMPNTDEVMNTEQVELQLFIGTLNRILELHTNGVKKMFYRWKHFKIADIGAKKRLSNAFNAVASPQSDYDDSHVVRAGDWNHQQLVVSSSGSAHKSPSGLHLNVSPSGIGQLHAPVVDQFSPVSMSDLSSSTIQEMGNIEKIKKTASQLRMSKINSPYATLKSTRKGSPTRINSSSMMITSGCANSFEQDVYSRIEPMIRNNEFTLEKIYFHFCSHKGSINKLSTAPIYDRRLMSELDLWYLLMTFGVCPNICSKAQLSHCINVIITSHVPVSGSSPAIPGTPMKGKALPDESMEAGIISFIHFVKILWQVSYLCKSSAADNPPPSVQFAYLLQIMDSSGGRQKIAQLSRVAQMIPPFIYLNILSDIY